MTARNMIIVTVCLLAGAWGLAQPARAADVNMICTSANNTITCTAILTNVVGPITVSWTGGPNPDLDENKTMRSFRCSSSFFTPPEPVSVSVLDPNDRFSPFARDSEGIKCVGTPFLRRIQNIFCQPSLTALAGLPNGNYIVCDVVWDNDGSPATVQWVSPRSNAPVVNTQSAEGRSTAYFNCNNPGGTEFTFSAFVTVTNASGSVSTPPIIPCGW